MPSLEEDCASEEELGRKQKVTTDSSSNAFFLDGSADDGIIPNTQ